MAAAEDGRLVVRQRGDGAAAVRRLEDVRGDGKDCRVTRRTTTSLQVFPAGVCVCVCMCQKGAGLTSPGQVGVQSAAQVDAVVALHHEGGQVGNLPLTQHNTTQRG